MSSYALVQNRSLFILPKPKTIDKAKLKPNKNEHVIKEYKIEF